MRTLNSAGLELIIAFESFSSKPYLDQGSTWTIGYGHTEGVDAVTPPMTEPEARALLLKDVASACASVTAAVHVLLSDNQYAALVSLVYNTGPAPLARGLGTKLNQGDYKGAADEFLRWRLTGGMVSDGLVRRRTAERALFLKTDS